MKILACVLLYLFLAVLTFGMTFADLQSYHPGRAVRHDAGFAVFCALLTPGSTLVVFLASGFAEHGLLFVPPAAELRGETR